MDGMVLGRRSSSEPRISTRELCVASWNGKLYGPSTHAGAVAAEIERHDCDVLLLYEINNDWYFPERMHALGYTYGAFLPTTYFGRLRSIEGSIALLSRLPIPGGVRVTETRPTSRGLRKIQRHYIEADIQLSDGHCLTVGGTHNALPWDPCFPATCRALAHAVEQHHERFLFAGDLNAFPNYWIIKRLCSSLTHLGPPFNEKSHGKLWHRRVDYAFATDDVCKRLVEARFGDFGPSDHKPLLVRLALPDER